QRHAAHAGLPLPVRPGPDRRHRGLSQDRAGSRRGGPAARRQARRARRRLTHPFEREFVQGRHAMTRASATLAGLLAALVSTTMLVPAHADAILSGAVAGAGGDHMGGVAVSAKADSSTITTTVYTGADGSYYFPPLAPGKYHVWAQALTFATANAEVDISANKAQTFTLTPLKDYVRQLPGEAIIDSLPAAPKHDKKMKPLVYNSCSSCHTPRDPQ